jgi:hypothetical protein
MRQTVIIVLATVLVIEANHYFLERSRRKMVAHSIMALLSDLSTLAGKSGYSSWIAYLEETHGHEKALSYLTRLYGTLQKSRVPGEQYQLLERGLREYLTGKTNAANGRD